MQFIMYFQFCGIPGDMSPPLAAVYALVCCMHCVSISHCSSHPRCMNAFTAVRADECKQLSLRIVGDVIIVVYSGSNLLTIRVDFAGKYTSG